MGGERGILAHGFTPLPDEWCFILGGLDSLETTRVGKRVSGPPHKCDYIGVSLGLSVTLGCVGFLSLRL